MASSSIPRARSSETKIAAKGTKLFLLQEAQQFRLKVERYFADLVQEYGAPTGGFYDTGTVAIGPREGAPNGAEYFGFPQCARYRGVNLLNNAIPHRQWKGDGD